MTELIDDPTDGHVRPRDDDLAHQVEIGTGALRPDLVRRLYWFTSSTSFANPAVTVARTLSDTFAGIAPSSAPMFIVARLVGLAIAFGLVRLFYPHTAPEAAR